MKKLMIGFWLILISSQAFAGIIFENYLNPNKGANPVESFTEKEFACITLAYSNPIGWQVIEAMEIAKGLKLIRDRKHCFEIVEDTKQITEAITKENELADVIHGFFGRCGCKFVFKEKEKEEENK